jgi:hypothetical protein
MQNRLTQKYLIFVSFCVKNLNADDFNVSTFKFHLKLFLQADHHSAPFESINSK